MGLTRTEGGAVYNSGETGELLGSTNNTTPRQLPNIPCSAVRFKAPTTNTAKIYLGFVNTVTVKAGTTNLTAGLPISPGDDTDWLPISNLNLLWIVSDNAVDSLTYMALG